MSRDDHSTSDTDLDIQVTPRSRTTPPSKTSHDASMTPSERRPISDLTVA